MRIEVVCKKDTEPHHRRAWELHAICESGCSHGSAALVSQSDSQDHVLEPVSEGREIAAITTSEPESDRLKGKQRRRQHMLPAREA